MSRRLNFAPEHGKYPLPELLTLSVSKPVDRFTNFDHLLVGQILEELKRVKRAHGDRRRKWDS